MRPTIHDVAKKVGVSTTTVSKVFNNTGRISESTKQKILQAIDELNYRPSVMATALKGKLTSTIGLLIPDLANPFFAELSRRIEDRGHELGYNLFICSTDYDPDKEKEYISLFKNKGVDGIICASGCEDHSSIVQLLEENFPIGVVARNYDSLEIDTVTTDDFMGGYKATSYLIELGHKDIAIIAKNVQSNRVRIDGYLKAMEENGLKPRTDFEFTTAMSTENGRIIAHKYLKSSQPPTAIFALNDLLAVGAMQAAAECGLRIPEDISIIGFDNSFVASIVIPPLTSVSQPTQTLGKEIVDLIDARIKEENKEKTRILLSPKLIIRKTTTEPN